MNLNFNAFSNSSPLFVLAITVQNHHHLDHPDNWLLDLHRMSLRNGKMHGMKGIQILRIKELTSMIHFGAS